MDNKDGTEDIVYAEILFIEENPGTHPTIVLASSLVSDIFKREIVADVATV
jgi:hypothetical protein